MAGRMFEVLVFLAVSQLAFGQAATERNLDICLAGRYPVLCNHSLLTRDQLRQAYAAERRENLKLCMTGKYPALCDHSKLSVEESEGVRSAERAENLTVCLAGTYQALCNHELLTTDEWQRVRAAEKTENLRVCADGRYPALCNHQLLSPEEGQSVAAAEARALAGGQPLGSQAVLPAAPLPSQSSAPTAGGAADRPANRESGKKPLRPRQPTGRARDSLGALNEVRAPSAQAAAPPSRPSAPVAVRVPSGDYTWLWFGGLILVLGGPALVKAVRDRLRAKPCSECSGPTSNVDGVCDSCSERRRQQEAAARRDAARRESEERARAAAEAQRVHEEEQRRRLRSLEDLQRLDGVQFEKLVASLFTRDGYTVRRCGGCGDEGIDLIIEVRGASDVVQCKRWKADVGAAVVREFYGSLMHAGARHGFIITTAKFSDAARQFARGKPITLIDGHRVLQWLEGHYAAGTAAETQKAAGETVDPYEVLGVPRNATKDQIRASYKRMIAMYHPDKVAHLGPDLQEVAELKARELNWAYELLINRVSGDRAV